MSPALVGGCFDPLHSGHLAYFEAAREWGPLWCAVATDDQVRAAKQRPPLLPQADRMAVLRGFCEHVIAQDSRGTAGVLLDLNPSAYVKGYDWQGRLPAAEVEACEGLGILMVFVKGTQHDSSSTRLRRYQQALDSATVTRFETLVRGQARAAIPWTPVTDNSFEARKQIEGQHPQLIKDVFAPERPLDAGMGAGHLVHLLRDLGLEARGFDITRTGTCFGDIAALSVWTMTRDRTGTLINDWGFLPRQADLVICREVLEHLTIKEIGRAVRNLAQLSSKWIYITTRFHPDPTHLLDVATSDDLDPTHITLLSKPFLRALFVLEGCRSRPDLEKAMDWKHLGRCLVFEVA